MCSTVTIGGVTVRNGVVTGGEKYDENKIQLVDSLVFSGPVTKIALDGRMDASITKRGLTVSADSSPVRIGQDGRIYAPKTVSVDNVQYISSGGDDVYSQQWTRNIVFEEGVLESISRICVDDCACLTVSDKDVLPSTVKVGDCGRLVCKKHAQPRFKVLKAENCGDVKMTISASTPNQTGTITIDSENCSKVEIKVLATSIAEVCVHVGNCASLNLDSKVHVSGKVRNIGSAKIKAPSSSVTKDASSSLRYTRRNK